MEDHEEFRAFVAARYPALVRTARLLVADTGQAEDLTQTALLTTFVHWRSIREPHAAEGTVKSRASRAIAALRSSGLLDDSVEAHDG